MARFNVVSLDKRTNHYWEIGHFEAVSLEEAREIFARDFSFFIEVPAVKNNVVPPDDIPGVGEKSS